MINIYLDIINYNELKKYVKEIQKNKKYIPLLLQKDIITNSNFYRDMKIEEKIKFRKARNNLPEDYDERQEYLKKDLIDWIKENPKYKTILK